MRAAIPQGNYAPLILSRFDKPFGDDELLREIEETRARLMEEY